MANPIVRGFSKLAQFSGRDTRGEFWPYAGTVVVLVFFIGGMAGAVFMSRIIAELAPYATDNEVLIAPAAPSDQVLVEVASPPPPVITPMPDLQPFILIQAATAALTIALLAAAVSRRLHDRSTSGWWGLSPVPFIALGLLGFHALFRDFGVGEPNLGLFGLLFLNNVAYLAALVTLIILLALPGSPRANRHGEARTAAPVRPVDDWSASS